MTLIGHSFTAQVYTNS